MPKRKRDAGYEVGYGKPPKSGRFKKGQSGNPKGRPMARKNVTTMVEEVFFRKITISENGRRFEVTLLEAMLRQLANGAARGEPRYIDRVLKLMPMLEQARAAALTGNADQDPADRKATDQAVLTALADMFGSDPEELFATVQTEAGDDGSVR